MENYIEFPNIGFKFGIERVAFKIGSFEVYWYAIFIACGLLLALVYAYLNAEKFKNNKDSLLDAAIFGVIGGVIGARLYYVIFNFSIYKDNLAGIFNLRDGGLAIYGGIIGGLGAGIIVAKIKKMNVMGLLDVAGLGFLIGQGIGRWGNFFNQEAFGANTSLPWAMTGNKIKETLIYEQSSLVARGIGVDPNMPVHPCFLYEFIWCAVGFILLHTISKKKKFDGQIFLLYIGWYGLGRFFIEGLRTDNLMIGSFRISQIVSIICILAAILFLILFSRRQKVISKLQAAGTDTDKIKVNLFTLKTSEIKEVKPAKATNKNKKNETSEVKDVKNEDSEDKKDKDDLPVSEENK